VDERDPWGVSIRLGASFNEFWNKDNNRPSAKAFSAFIDLLMEADDE